MEIDIIKLAILDKEEVDKVQKELSKHHESKHMKIFGVMASRIIEKFHVEFQEIITNALENEGISKNENEILNKEHLKPAVNKILIFYLAIVTMLSVFSGKDESDEGAQVIVKLFSMIGNQVDKIIDDYSKIN